MRGIGARFVYVLRSESNPSRHYVGRTANVEGSARVAQPRSVRVHAWAPTVVHRRVAGISEWVSGGALREVPEVRLRSRVCEAASWL